MAIRLVRALNVAMDPKYQSVNGRVDICADREMARLLSIRRGTNAIFLKCSVSGIPRIMIPDIAAHDSWKPMSNNEAGSVRNTMAILTTRMSSPFLRPPDIFRSNATESISAARIRLLGQPVMMA